MPSAASPCCSYTGLTLSSTASALIPGFVVAGIGIGFVNAPLASTAVSVVEPRHAGMASGTNNTFRQIGIATGIAALGAIFQSRILLCPFATRTSPVSVPCTHSRRRSRRAPTPHGSYRAIGRLRSSLTAADVAHSAFITGLNTIFVVAAFVLFAGAILAFVLVRQQDFVASGPQVAAESG